MEEIKETTREKKNNREKAYVKHSNQLAEIPLRGFTAMEIDLFFGLAFFLQGQEDDEVTISFSEIRDLLGIERRGNLKLLEALDATSDKFGRLSIEERTDTKFKKIKPFIGFEADAKLETFTVQAHKEFVKALNDLDGSFGKRYTKTDVKAIARVKSIFSKQALKMMFLYRNKGYWYVTVENLRYYLSIPPGYKQNDIKRRVIDVIEKELTEGDILEFLEITENKEENKKATGRKKVLGYTFHFKFIPDEESEGSVTAKEDEVSIKCPKCGRPLYLIERNDGEGSFFGHRGGQRKDAKCRYTMSADFVVEPSSVEVVENEEDIVISKGELESYYRELREESKREAANRKEEIRKNDPELWNYYEERERKVFDFVDALSSMTLTEESKERRRIVKEEAEASRQRLEEALVERGYSKDYFELHFKCEKCKDEGVLKDGRFCSCRAERAAEAKEWLEKRS